MLTAKVPPCPLTRPSFRHWFQPLASRNSQFSGGNMDKQSTVVNVLIRMLDPSHWVAWDQLYK